MSNGPSIGDPTSWGIDLPDRFPEVAEDPEGGTRVEVDWISVGGGTFFLRASDSADARQKAGWAYRDALAFAAMADWFDTREERELEQVAQEFNADLEGNPLPADVLVESLLTEIVRLRKKEHTA